MKKTTLSILSAILSLLCLLSFVACQEKTETTDLWFSAAFLSDATVGEGAKTVTLLIEAGEKTVTLTLKTDKDKLGDAMFAEGLINDASFFNVLNGIEASWEKDNAYWAFYQGEILMNHGVNDTEIKGGESFRFVYTK